MKIAVRFCNGCRPRINRNAMAAFIKSRIAGPHVLVDPACFNTDLVVIIKGCDAACGDDKMFAGIGTRLISDMEGARSFLSEISEDHG